MDKKRKWWLVMLRKTKHEYFPLCHREGSKKDIIHYYRHSDVQLVKASDCKKCGEMPPYDPSPNPVLCNDCYKDTATKMYATLERLANGKKE